MVGPPLTAVKDRAENGPAQFQTPYGLIFGAFSVPLVLVGGAMVLWIVFVGVDGARYQGGGPIGDVAIGLGLGMGVFGGWLLKMGFEMRRISVLPRGIVCERMLRAGPAFIYEASKMTSLRMEPSKTLFWRGQGRYVLYVGTGGGKRTSGEGRFLVRDDRDQPGLLAKACTALQSGLSSSFPR